MLKNFTCKKCGGVEAVRGGTCAFVCSRCKPLDHYTLQPAYLAHTAVAKARREGRLSSPRDHACTDCGAAAIEYDHRDYLKPLAVDPVCRRCNILRGPAKQVSESTKSGGVCGTEHSATLFFCPQEVITNGSSFQFSFGKVREPWLKF